MEVIYGTLQPKVYQTTITIREASKDLFKNNIDDKLFVFDFDKNFKLNLTSIDHLSRLVEQSEKFNELNLT